MNIELLKTIIAGTDSAAGYSVIDGNDDARALSDADLIEVNPGVPGLEAGKVAARVTDAGRAAAIDTPVEQTPAWSAPTNFGEAAAQAATTAPAQSEQPKTAFVPVNGATFAPAAPVRREGAKRDMPEKYPFGSLKAPTKRENGSIDYTDAVIFVPSNVDKTGKVRTPDEMAFSLQSACSAANRRYGRELPASVGTDGKSRKKYEYDRTFKTQGGTQDGVPGAYIYREYKEGASA